MPVAGTRKCAAASCGRQVDHAGLNPLTGEIAVADFANDDISFWK